MPRKHVLKSAGYWFDAAVAHRDKGEMAEAIMALEQAYNHVENALAATRNKFIEAVEDIENEGMSSKEYRDFLAIGD